MEIVYCRGILLQYNDRDYFGDKNISKGLDKKTIKPAKNSTPTLKNLIGILPEA